MPHKGPRYPEANQDPNEEGLSLLRKQFINAGMVPEKVESTGNWRIKLGWKPVRIPPKHQLPSREIEIVGLPEDCAIRLYGDEKKINALATLISRAIHLGWFMLNELEPEEPKP